MSKQQQIIMINSEIANNEKFRLLKSKKELSQLINNLLKGYLSIKETEIPQELTEIKEELYKIEAKKSVLLERKEEIEKKTPKLTPQEIAQGWFINSTDGKKYRRMDF